MSESNEIETNGNGSGANVPTWEYKGKTYPLFLFDEKPIIKLPNGTVHQFRMWDETTEKKAEDFLKSIVVTSPAVINGENPRDVKTDFTRSALAYYEMMIEKVAGVGFSDSDDAQAFRDAKAILEGETLPNGKPARLLDAIAAPIRKNAATRLYSGTIVLENDIDEDGEDVDFDPFASIEEVDISAEIEKFESRQQVYKLSLDRNYVIRQEIGSERLKSGVTVPPTHIIRYHFREPEGEHFSKWDMKGSKGFAVSLPKGGMRAETYYNLDTMKFLFESLIDRIEGAGVNRAEIQFPSDRNDPRRKAILAQIPLRIKKLTMSTLFNEMSNLGNS